MGQKFLVKVGEKASFKTDREFYVYVDDSGNAVVELVTPLIVLMSTKLIRDVCKCGQPVEMAPTGANWQYKFCYKCWWDQDPRSQNGKS